MITYAATTCRSDAGEPLLAANKTEYEDTTVTICFEAEDVKGCSLAVACVVVEAD